MKVFGKATRMRKAGGFTLIEVMLVVFVMVITALMFAAAFPTSQISRIKSVHMTYAASLAQQKIEELKSGGYNSLVAGTVSGPIGDLPGGNQTVIISQYAAHIKKIDVDITWGGYRKVGGHTRFVTLVSDHN